MVWSDINFNCRGGVVFRLYFILTSIFVFSVNVFGAKDLSVSCQYDRGLNIQFSKISESKIKQNQYGNFEMFDINTDLSGAQWARIVYRREDRPTLTFIFGPKQHFPNEYKIHINLCGYKDPSTGDSAEVGQFIYSGNGEDSGGVGQCTKDEIQTLADMFKAQCGSWAFIPKAIQYEFKERDSREVFSLQITEPGAKFIRVIFEWSNFWTDDSFFRLQDSNNRFVQSFERGPVYNYKSYYADGDTVTLEKIGYIPKWGFSIKGIEVIR